MNLTHLVLPAFPSMLSQTLKQMKAFQGAIRYCRMQLPDYSVLTMLLKQALKEMQSQEFTRVEWIPGSQHTFQKPEKSLTQTPALGLPSQTKFHLYIAERQGTAPGNNVRSISSSQTDSWGIRSGSKGLLWMPGSSCYCQTPDSWNSKDSLGLLLTLHMYHYTGSF